MQVDIIEDLASEPITVAEARQYLRITTTTQDSLISALITSARMRLEKFCNLSFGAKTIQVYYDSVNDWRELPYQPFATITSVEDLDGNALQYEERGTVYKSFKCFGESGVIVTYEVLGILNEGIKEAIKREVLVGYDFRGNDTPINTLSKDSQYLVQPFSRNTLLGI